MPLSARVKLTATGILLAIGVGVLGWELVNLYSADGPDAGFLAPTQEYLEAAVALDSTRLVHLGAAPLAVRRALDAARERRVFLRALLSDLHLRHSSHNGVHTALFFNSPTLTRCGEWPLTVFVEGPPRAARIQDVHLGCAEHSTGK